MHCTLDGYKIAITGISGDSDGQSALGSKADRDKHFTVLVRPSLGDELSERTSAQMTTLLSLHPETS